jgi:paraquat-inducible protein B
VSSPTNQWKLGLFVVASSLLTLAATAYLGALSLENEAVSYTSYFDESVTGLEVGSAVKFRGVTIGTVSDIQVAPDRRHVETSYELGVEVLSRLGLSSGEGQGTKLAIPEGLRAQVGSAGITGIKYILIDFFDPKSNPVKQLNFPVPDNYIPGARSTMKNLEDSVVQAVDRFPVLAEEMLRVLVQVNAILSDIQSKNVPEKAIVTMNHVDESLVMLQQTLVVLQQKMNDLDTVALTEDTRKLLATLDKTALEAQVALKSVQSASASFGDVAINARNVGPEMSQALRDVSEAAVALREILEILELDSDMLIKGRSVDK